MEHVSSERSSICIMHADTIKAVVPGPGAFEAPVKISDRVQLKVTKSWAAFCKRKGNHAGI
jgi:hypothetical protein